jgi:enoyl-CoA hydratase/carnithine racemase
MSVAVDVLSLRPAALTAPVPLWEVGVPAGEVGVAIIDGSPAEWNGVDDARGRALRELLAAPVVTVGVVRGPEAAPLAGECDLVVEQDRVDELVTLITRAGAPGLVAAQLLRAGDSRLATESFAYSMLLGGDEFAAWRARKPPVPAADRGPRVQLERAGSCWKLTLSRPERHNAFDARMREELCDALDAAASDAEAPLVIVGAGPSFCSGGDLDEFGTADGPVAAHLVRTGRSVARRLERLRPRLVVGVHGHCVGAGVEFASFAGVVVAARETSFALPELSLGLNLGAGGTVSIPARIGRHRTLEWLLSSEPIDATTALRWGLVDQIADRGELEARCLAAAEALA